MCAKRQPARRRSVGFQQFLEVAVLGIVTRGRLACRVRCAISQRNAEAAAFPPGKLAAGTALPGRRTARSSTMDDTIATLHKTEVECARSFMHKAHRGRKRPEQSLAGTQQDGNGGDGDVVDQAGGQKTLDR